MFLGGEQAETSQLFWETTEIPSHSVKAMKLRPRGPEKVSEEPFQFLIGGFRGSPAGRVIDMSGCENLGVNLEFARKGKWFGDPIVKFLGDLS